MTFFADSEKEPAVSLNFLSSFFAHINSVANIARPIGITIMAGPGVKNNMHPINTTEIPIKNIANFLICLYSISGVIVYFGNVTPVCF